MSNHESKVDYMQVVPKRMFGSPQNIMNSFSTSCLGQAALYLNRNSSKKPNYANAVFTRRESVKSKPPSLKGGSFKEPIKSKKAKVSAKRKKSELPVVQYID
jgi:hypothetical protein